MLASGLRALKWSWLGELGARVVGPFVFILLARILVPEDFGVVAAATVVLSFTQVVTELGLPKALVQRETRVAEAADTAFWLSLGFGAVLMVALVAMAHPVAQFFGEPRVVGVLMVLAPTMPVAAATAVPMALMQREMAFRAVFWVRLGAATLPALVSVPTALAGGGFWALVVGAVASTLLQAAFVARLTAWRPRRRFNAALAAELLRFGGWALASSLLGWSYAWLDALIVGRALGTHDMGVYRTGLTFVTLVFGTMFSPLMPVAYSLFSRAQHDVPRVREALATAVRAMALVALPLALAVWSAREWLAGVVLGPSWEGAALVIGVLALAQGGAWLVSLNGELYRAVGRPAAEVLATGPMLAIYLVVYLWAVRHGMETFLWARVALVLLALVVHILVCRAVVQMPLRLWLRPGLGLLALAGLAWSLQGATLAVSVLATLGFAAALATAEAPLLRRMAAGLR